MFNKGDNYARSRSVLGVLEFDTRANLLSSSRSDTAAEAGGPISSWSKVLPFQPTQRILPDEARVNARRSEHVGTGLAREETS